jgi:rhodanese-related sulfurtransferase
MQRLANAGISLVDSNFVASAYNDPKRSQGLIIFVDAREDSQYQRGHVPGAYQLDYYRPEPHLPVVLPAVMGAEATIIYCNGGDCEDSEFAAIFLRDAGVAPAKLHVYRGGFGEWLTNGLPVEVGARNSGVIQSQ